MKTFFRKVFIDNWQRKTISLLLAIVIWFLVNQSLTSSKTIGNIPVRIINLPPGKTIVDLQSNGLLSKRITLTLIGNKMLLDELSATDFEVVIDAQNKQGEWIASITKRNLVSLNPDLDLNKGITRISHASINIRLAKLATEKIPIFISQPIGDAPKGYQYLDIWPYQLTVSVTGPEEAIKRLKIKGVRLTFDLSEISKTELDNIQVKPGKEEVSFLVPDNWKRISIPLISDTPIEIDDPKAKELRIDFARISTFSISKPIPVALFFPVDQLQMFNPKNITIAPNRLVHEEDGVLLLSETLLVKGVSQLFLQVVQEMMELVIIVEPNSQKRFLDWSIQFINPKLLEDRFVSLSMADSEQEVKELQPTLRDEYLRNRFRNYLNGFQLYKTEDKRFELNITLENNKVVIRDSNSAFQTASQEPIPINSQP